MVEMSKGLKIILIVDIVVAVYYGVLYLLLPEFYYQRNDASAFDLHMWRLFGGTIFVLGIAGIIALKRGEWEAAKPLMEVVIMWLIMVAVLDIVLLITVSVTPTYIWSTSTTIVLIIILIIVNIYFYQREGK